MNDDADRATIERLVPTWTCGEAHTGPLFKFRAFDPERDLDANWQGYAASLLLHNLVYCSSPWDLNDPWECRPAFVIPNAESDPAAARAFVNAMVEQQPDADKEGARRWLQEQGFEVAARRLQDGLHRSNLGLGIYSVAGNGTHPLMWSHYAAGHRGYCWIFDNKVAPFSRAAKVTYQNAYPEIDWARWREQDVTIASIFTKSDIWQHEEEFRVLLPRRDAPEVFRTVAHNGNGEPPRGRFLQIPPAALIGVVFGGGMKRDQARALYRLILSSGRKLELMKAGIHRRKYEMAIGPIPADQLARLESGQ